MGQTKGSNDMKVTPKGKNFNQHKIGSVFDLPDKTAKVLISIGLLEAASEISTRTGQPKRTYTRRDMRAES
jgi:hypothetical protein